MSFSKVRLLLIVMFTLCLAAGAATAGVKLPATFTDGMVLQRNRPLTLCGAAEPNEAIILKLHKLTLRTTADTAGHWQLQLPPLTAGGPYTLRVNDTVVNDILVGDVWLCSGQSNMELPVSRVMERFSADILAYENPKIRQFEVPDRTDFHAPQSDLPAGIRWTPLTQAHVMKFSALAYFFARELFRRTGIPQGIVNCCWGGTPVEAWMSETSLHAFPMYLNKKCIYDDDNFRTRLKETEELAMHRWNLALYRGDAGLHETTPWYAAHYDDSSWQSVDLFSTGWGANRLTPVNGSHWFRREVTVPESWEHKEPVLRLGCLVDADSVFVNGVLVGTTSYQYPPRIYHVPAGVLKAGKNQLTVRLISYSGAPHFVPEKPYTLSCSEGTLSLEGAWRYRLGTPMPQAPPSTFFHYQPVCLYNAMIAPLREVSFAGVLWYQGESNVDRRDEYASLLTAMIADWRHTFKHQDLPFYLVELADFLSPADTDGRAAWAEMRREQASVAVHVPHVTLIRNADLGEWNDIHPLDKRTLGIRCADAVSEEKNAASQQE